MNFTLRRNLLLILLTLFICSCSSSRKDGPPSYYVDVSRIPDAVPKPEPLAKYGNKPFYYVFGKRYYVMPSSKNYVAVGTASWYGTKFHSRKTSSGEPYNMLAMTAAHKTLPLPTYVEVTNLRNGRKVIVKVNDRGPFVGNRLIDLSYVAARKLEMYGHGTTRVRVRAIDPYEYLYGKPQYTHVVIKKVTVRRVIKNPQPIKGMYLQVGAFKNKANALHLQSRLIKLIGGKITLVRTKGSDLFRVYVGPVATQKEVYHLNNRLRRLGMKALLIKH